MLFVRLCVIYRSMIIIYVCCNGKHRDNNKMNTELKANVPKKTLHFICPCDRMTQYIFH